jgi:hypothetical protein
MDSLVSKDLTARYAVVKGKGNMEQWQKDLQSALADRDIDKAKDILFRSYFTPETLKGESSSIHGLTSVSAMAIVDDLDSDTRKWLEGKISE